MKLDVEHAFPYAPAMGRRYEIEHPRRSIAMLRVGRRGAGSGALRLLDELVAAQDETERLRELAEE